MGVHFLVFIISTLRSQIYILKKNVLTLVSDTHKINVVFSICKTP